MSLSKVYNRGDCNITSREDRNKILAAILLLMAALPRIFLYFSLLKSDPQAVSHHLNLYYEALRHHFFEYLWYSTNIPPLTHILNAIVFAAFGLEVSYMKLIFLAFTFLLDTVGILLLYSAARRFNIPWRVSFLTVLFFSFLIIPFEIWRFGNHYDHHTLFFTMIYVYSISRLYSDTSFKNIVFISLVGALFMAQSSINSYVVPVVSALVVVSLNWKQDVRDIIRKTGIVLAGPVLIFLIIAGKNYFIAGSFSTSTKSGPAMMMFVRSALKNDNDRILRLIKKAGAPEWYIYCFNNSMVPPSALPGTPTYDAWSGMAKDFGVCFPRTENADANSGFLTDTGIGGKSWPYNFEALRVKLIELGENQIIEKVDRDIYDMQYRQYLFAGYSYELSPRWIGIYGNVSMKVGKKLLLDEPFTYLKNIRKTHNVYYFGGGPSFFRRTLYSSKTPPSLSTLSGPMPGERFFLVITETFEILSKIIYCASPLYLVLLGTLYLLRERKFLSNINAKIGRGFRVFLFMAAPASLISLLFSSSADLENDRYFVQITPYLTIISGYFAGICLDFFPRLKPEGS